ncbi:DNA-directed DNA/RNA polymerase mu [Leucoagaricus sp. SymC.cos]|nr:DNA-directed DNA/RNA polymerase mu [Leucoagaricus sp. SymC.cos]
MSGKRTVSPGSVSRDRPSKRRRSDSVGSIESWDGASNQCLRVFVLQAKFDEKQISEIYHLIESHGPRDGDGLQLQLCSDPKDADIIITNVRMPKRLERHLDWHTAKQKALVTPDWLQASVKQNSPAPCGSFAAVTQLRQETAESCPPQAQRDDESHQSPKPTISPSPTRSARSREAGSQITKPTSDKVANNWRSRFACARASPLVCPNQGLAIALNVLGQSRELEGLSFNALAYERAVAVIKSYPYLITRETFERDVTKLPGIGSKVKAKIEEYLENGEIEETETTLHSERYRSLSLFTTVHGIGPSTARHLYEIGLRTIEDLERYFDIEKSVDTNDIRVPEAQFLTPNGQPIPRQNVKGDEKIPPISTQVALALRNDLTASIPRSEVEEMHQIVMAELDEIQPGCTSTIAGGYRRGKSQSNDIDIVITHTDIKHGAAIIKGLCAKLTKRLHERGLYLINCMVTHVMHLSGFHAHNPLRTEHWDSLEKALTVFRLPAAPLAPESQSQADSSAARGRLHRRLDLIFAPPETYWTAVIGWSGSRLFERDLRLWAKTEKGMKFDSSGLTRRHDSKFFIPKSEEDVFRILGLEWIDPTMRNANV